MDLVVHFLQGQCSARLLLFLLGTLQKVFNFGLFQLHLGNLLDVVLHNFVCLIEFDCKCAIFLKFWHEVFQLNADFFDFQVFLRVKNLDRCDVGKTFVVFGA